MTNPIAQEIIAQTDVLRKKKEEAARQLDIPLEYVKTCHDIGIQMAKDVRRNFNAFITVAGTRPSIGKTSAAASILEWFERQNDSNSKLLRDEMMMKLVREHFVYTGLPKKMLDDFKRKYFSLPRYSGIIVDEAKRLAYKRRFGSEVNMEVNEFIAECRKLVNESGENVGNKMMAMCVDSLFSLDKDTRSQVNIHFEVISRGVAIIIEPDPTPAPDKWYMDYFQKAKLKYLDSYKLKVVDLKDLSQQVHLYLDMPNFSGVMIYPNLDLRFNTEDGRLPGPVETEYLRFDKDAKLVMSGDLTSRDIKDKAKKENLVKVGQAYLRIKEMGRYTLQEIAALCKVNRSYVSDAINAALLVEAPKPQEETPAPAPEPLPKTNL